MHVSILIAALDTTVLKNTIDDVLASVDDSIDYEIVATTPVAFEAPRTRIVVEDRPAGAVRAYNAAAAVARGSFIAHITDGKRLRRGWLDAALAAVAARDRGGPPYIACLPMFDVQEGDAFVGTAMGRLYPWFFLAHRRLLDLVGPYFDESYKGSFIDVDLGFRIWAAGGRCEIVPGGAWYDHAPDEERVRLGPRDLDTDFNLLFERWFSRFGADAGYGERQPDGRIAVAPWHVCLDVPSTFFAHFVRDRTIVQTGREWPRIAAFLRTATRLMNKDGIDIPGSVLADPTHLPDWVLAVTAARQRAAQSGITPNGSL
jgi:hypothetical protein